jgi:hypothetical protein
MTNLLEETLDVLKANGKTPDDVRWVGNKGSNASTWQEFKRLAKVNYDNGYGSAEIDTTLVVVGSDWWLERHEYDGSEWWEFKSLPHRPIQTPKPLSVKVGRGW